MNRERILSILYDLTSVIGGEVSLDPLVTKTLQRVMYHTGYPCGFMLLNNPDQEPDRASFRIAMAVGDRLALDHVGQNVQLRPVVSDDNPAFVSIDQIIDDLPCRKGKYHLALMLPIPGEGVILLLGPKTKGDQLPLDHMLTPVMAHLAKAIHLCQLNDKQKELLARQVEEGVVKLQESEERARLILASTAEAIYGLDLNGDCIFVNPVCLDLLGYEEHEILNRNIHDLIHHTHADGSAYPVENCRIFNAFRENKGTHVDDEVFWRRDGSSFPVEYRSFPIRKNDHVIGSVVTFFDITDRLNLEKEKAEERTKLEHTQRLESLGVLAGGIAHDFNNLLTAIIGNATLAQLHTDPASEAYALIQQVHDAGQSAADLCKQMLAYSGKGKFTVKPIHLSDLIRKISKLLEVSIHKHTSVVYDLATDIPCVEGDHAQFQQVVMNLITNANESLEGEYGVITITTGQVHVDPSYLEGEYMDEDLPPGDYVSLEVSDTGCGMSEEEKNRIFEPFFTTKVLGRGLGMSALLGIVRGHHGTLKVRTETGQGTSIKILFPASGATATEDVGSVPPSPAVQGKTILVIDDEALVLQVTSSLLKIVGFDILTASNGKEGIKVYAENMDRINLVMLDLMMPVMSGEDTFRQLQAINPEVKVVLCSGYNEQEATQKFSDLGLAGFIHKPYNLEALSSVLSDIISDEPE